MNVSVSADITAAGVTQTQSRPPPPPSGGRGEGPPSHATAIEKLGSSLSDDVKDSLLASVQELEESGASFEEIKSFVDNELEANGVDFSSRQSRSGQFIDIVS